MPDKYYIDNNNHLRLVPEGKEQKFLARYPGSREATRKELSDFEDRRSQNSASTPRGLNIPDNTGSPSAIFQGNQPMSPVMPQNKPGLTAGTPELDFNMQGYTVPSQGGLDVVPGITPPQRGKPLAGTIAETMQHMPVSPEAYFDMSVDRYRQEKDWIEQVKNDSSLSENVKQSLISDYQSNTRTPDLTAGDKDLPPAAKDWLERNKVSRELTHYNPSVMGGGSYPTTVKENTPEQTAFIKDYIANSEEGKRYAQAHKEFIGQLEGDADSLLNQIESIREASEKNKEAYAGRHNISAWSLKGTNYRNDAILGKAANLLKNTKLLLSASKEGDGFKKGLHLTDEDLKELAVLTESFYNDKALNQVIDKYQKAPGSLSEEEAIIIQAQYIADQINAGVDPGSWYNIGATTKQSLPFMRDFILTAPIGGAAASAVKGGASALAARTGANLLLSRGIGGTASSLAKGAIDLSVRPAMQTMFSPSSYAMAYQEMQGQAVNKDAQGNIIFDNRKTQGQGMTSAFIENQSEVLGEVVLDKLFQKFRIPVPAFLKTNAAKRLSSATGIQGPVTEYAEEKYADLANIVRGEQTIEGFFDPRQNLETFGAVAIMQIPFSAINATGYGIGRIRDVQAKRAIRQTYDRSADSLNKYFGEDAPQAALAFNKLVDNSTEEELRQELLSVIGDDRLDDNGKRAIVEYVTAYSAYSGINKAKQEDVAQVGQQMAQLADENINPQMNAVVSAVIAGNGNPVQVTGGNIVQREDGSIDSEASDKQIFYVDAEGNKQVTSIGFIESIGENIPAQDAIAQLIEMETANIISRQENEEVREYLPGETVTADVAGNGITFTGEVTGITQAGNYIIVSPVTGEQVEAEPRHIINQDNIQGVENGSLVEYRNDRGETVQGTVNDAYGLRPQGMMDIDGNGVPVADIIGLVDQSTVNSKQLTQESDNLQATTPESADNLQATGQQDKDIPAGEADNLTPTGQIPKDEKGNLLFEQAPVEATIGALSEVYNDTAELSAVVNATINNIRKQIDKAKAPKPTGDINKDIAGKRAANRQLEELNNRLSYWEEVRKAIRESKPLRQQITEQLTGEETPVSNQRINNTAAEDSWKEDSPEVNTENENIQPDKADTKQEISVNNELSPVESDTNITPARETEPLKAENQIILHSVSSRKKGDIITDIYSGVQYEIMEPEKKGLSTLREIKSGGIQKTNPNDRRYYTHATDAEIRLKRDQPVYLWDIPAWVQFVKRHPFSEISFRDFRNALGREYTDREQTAIEWSFDGTPLFVTPEDSDRELIQYYNDKRAELGDSVFTPDNSSVPDETAGDEAEKSSPAFGANNKLVTTERYEELKKRMRDKLNNLNIGIDPELFAIGAEMAVYNIEAGARKFADFAGRMIDDLGDNIRPYLKAFYEGARQMPGMETIREEMDSFRTVNSFDVDSIGTGEATSSINREEIESFAGVLANDILSRPDHLEKYFNNDRQKQDIAFDSLFGSAMLNHRKGHVSAYKQFVENEEFSRELKNKVKSLLNEYGQRRKNEKNSAGSAAVVAEKAAAIESAPATIGDSAKNVRDSTQAGEITEDIKDVKQGIESLISEIDTKLADIRLNDQPYSTQGIIADYPVNVLSKDIKKDVEKFVRAIARIADLDFDTDRKGKPEICHVNIAPAGGNATFILWSKLHPGTGVYVSIPYRPDYNNHGYDNYRIPQPGNGFDFMNQMLWRLTTRKDKYRGLDNRYINPGITAKEFAETIVKELNNHYLRSGLDTPKEQVEAAGHPAESEQQLTPAFDGEKPINGTDILTNGDDFIKNHIVTGTIAKQENNYDTENNNTERLPDRMRQSAGGMDDRAPAGGTVPNDAGRYAERLPGQNRERRDEGGTSDDRKRDESGGSRIPGHQQGGTALRPVGDGRTGTGGRTAEPRKDTGSGGIPGDHPVLNRNNFRTGDKDNIVPKGAVSKIRANIKAIGLLKKLEEEGRDATDNEKQILSQYSGWGGLAEVLNTTRKGESSWREKYGEYHDRIISLLTPEEFTAAENSTINAHYTSGGIIAEMWKLAERLGFKGGRVLEPALGTGNFFGLMPEHISSKSSLRAYELDSITGRIAAKLYPDARIQVKGYEESKDRDTDLIITNVPFGQKAPYDSVNRDICDFSLHNYFIAKGIKQLAPGGLGLFITSKSTMDSAASAKFREWVTTKGYADLIGAIRLPNTAFSENAGTEVTTDILVFRKRDSEKPGRYAKDFRFTNDIKEVKMRDGSPTVIEANEYFAQNPDMMLGELKLAYEDNKGGLYSGDDVTLAPHRGQDLIKALDEAIRSFPAGISDIENANFNEKAESGEKEGTMVDRDGHIYEVIDGELAVPGWINENTTTVRNKKVPKVKVARHYLRIKGIACKLIDAEREDKDNIEELRAELNREYDSFYNEYDTFNDNAKLRFLVDTDVEYNTVFALEKVKKIKKVDNQGNDSDKTTIEKADIFSKRILFPVREPVQADNIADALEISLSYRGSLDLNYIAGLTGLSADEAKEKLRDEGLAFVNPSTGLLEDRDSYLSGYVRSKYYEALEAAGTEPEFERNVKALEPVIPKDIPGTQIKIRLGSTFIPDKYYEEFVREKLKADAKIAYRPELNKYIVQLNSGKDSAENKTTYGTSYFSGIQLIEKGLNLKQPVAFDIFYEGGQPKRIKNQEKTAEAQAMLSSIADLFVNYIYDNEQAMSEIERVYNDKYNDYVEKSYSVPGIVHYPGANKDITLRQHQKRAVSRGLRDSVLLAHQVGTGKTFTKITIAMEMRRLGIAKKPMIAVQNATLEQYVASFRALYPGANILAPTKKMMDAKNRTRLFSLIAYGDYDAVIIPHSFLYMIPDDPQRQRDYLNEQIAELQNVLSDVNEDQDRVLYEELTRKIEQLQESLDEIDNPGKEKKSKKGRKVKDKAKKQLGVVRRITRQADRRTDNVLTFEKMGVDALVVDEAHNFKRLGLITKMGSVKGIDTSGSKRAYGVYMKVRYIHERTGGKNIVFATGTPITNTMAEAWTMMRYIEPDVLEKYDIGSFDRFATTFGSVEPSLEFTATGNFKVVDRFKSFINAPELFTAFRVKADVVLTEDIPEFKEGNTIPKLKGGSFTQVIVPQSDLLVEVMNQLKDKMKWWENLSPREKKKNRSVPIVVFGRAKQAAIDLRLINPALPDDPESKTNRVIAEVKRIYDASSRYRGTQLIFSDLFQSSAKIPGKRFNLYEDIKGKLVALGIPEHEVAIIHDYDEKNREKLFERVNEGLVRIVIGNTEKMGVGVNMQKRAVALHHIDAPARPMDFEQRNGRILRQGNLHAQMGIPVEVLTYGVEKTLDATAYQRLAIKQAFINQVMKGDSLDREISDEAEEDSPSDMDFMQMMAVLSGSKYAQLHFLRSAELKKLETAERNHLRRQVEINKQIKDYTVYKEYKEVELESLNRVKSLLDTYFPEGKITSVTINGKKQDEKLAVAIDEAINDYKQAFVSSLKTHMEMPALKVRFNSYPQAMELDYIDLINDNFRYFYKTDDYAMKGMIQTGAGLLNSLRSRIANIPGEIQEAKDKIEFYGTNIPVLKSELLKPFDKGEKLEHLRKEIAEIAEKMKAEVVTDKKEASATGRTIDSSMIDLDATEEGEDGEVVSYGGYPGNEEKANNTDYRSNEEDGEEDDETEDTAYPGEEKDVNNTDIEETQEGIIEPVSPYKHTQTGQVFYLAKIKAQVPAPVFSGLKDKAKSLNGSWSRFAKGFLFEDESKANEFRNKANSSGDIRRQALSSGSFRSITAERFGRLIDKLNQTGLAVDVVSDEDIRNNPEIKDTQGNVYGYVTPDGVIYLDATRMNANTPVHEFGHLWNSFIKENNPGLWKKGVELIKESDYWQRVNDIPAYKNLSEEAKVDEALAMAIGDKGESVFHKQNDLSLYMRVKGWLYDVWSTISKKLGISLGKRQVTIEDMSLSDFTDRAVRDLLGGERLTGNAFSVDKLSKQELSEMERIKQRSVNNSTFMKAPNGEPTNLNERQWLQVRTANFKNWFGDWENNPGNASKVIDGNGEPLVVYHGTKNGGWTSPYIKGQPVFFTSNKETAKGYAKKYHTPVQEDIPAKNYPHKKYAVNYGVFLNIREHDNLAEFNAGKKSYNSYAIPLYNPMTGSEGLGGLDDMARNVVYEQRPYIIRNIYDNKDYNENDLSDIYIVPFANGGMIKSATDNTGSFDPADNDIRFQSVSDIAIATNSAMTAAARHQLDGRLKNFRFRIREAWQDRHLAVKEFLDVLRRHGADIAGYNDYYKQATHINGKIDAGLENYNEKFQKPLNKAVGELEKAGFDYRAIENYAILKHGLERNKWMKEDAVRRYAKRYPDATPQQLGRFEINLPDDFSGITAVEAEVGTHAEGFIHEFEHKAGEELIHNFWKSIKNATLFSIGKQLEGGLIDKKTYDELAGRYDYYIPLRGHDDETAEDRWDYSPNMGTYFVAPLIRAKGRRTRSESPLAFIFSMAQSAVSSANRNILNQTILRLALKDKTGLLGVNKAWYMQTGLNEDGVPVYEIQAPAYSENTDQYRINIEEFEERMQKLQEQGLAVQNRGKLDIGGLFIKKTQASQHVVYVSQNGAEYAVYINGNPAVARAINGINAKDLHKDLRFIAKVSRQMAANFTTRNPIFVATNFSRDYIFASSILGVKEDAKYALQFQRNIPRSAGALQRYIRNKADLSEKADRYVIEYIMNGGKTGFSHLVELDAVRRKIEREIKKGDSKSVLRTFLDALEGCNEFAENLSRLSVYITSREQGRPVVQSISDAKEVTVNFNRNGAGGYGAAWFRSLYLFVNAGIQALSNFAKVAQKNKGKTAILISSYALSGFLMPLLTALTGGDDGLDDYMKLSDWERQNNLCLYTGSGFIKIPLPHELRVFHAMGDNIYQAVFGRKDIAETLLDVIISFSDLIPANPAGSIRGSWADMMPDAVKPFFQLKANRNYTGGRITNEWADENKPGYLRIRTNKKGEPYAPAFLVKLGESLDNATGGDGVEKGIVSFNPDEVNHLIHGYFGGLYATGMQILDMSYKAYDWMDTGELKLKVRETPLKTFYTSGSDLMTAGSGLNPKYFKIADDMQETRRKVKGYKEQAQKGDLTTEEFAAKINSFTPDIERYKRIYPYIKQIRKYESALKELEGEEQKEAEKIIANLKKEVVQMY